MFDSAFLFVVREVFFFLRTSLKNLVILLFVSPDFQTSEVDAIPGLEYTCPRNRNL